MPTRVLIPSGVLGLGLERDALRRGIAREPHAIAIDGGSTDSGPFYLGSGVSKYSRASTRTEWRVLMEARAEAGVPLIIGSAGTCGTDAMVDWMTEITDDEELPTFAFPWSPAETDRGPLYEFRLNHALVLDDPMSAFTLDTLELGNGATR